MKRVLFFLLSCWVCASATCGAETWAEKLGYPSGKKVLILYATRMGTAYEFNRAGQELLSRGAVRSAGVLPPCPWFDEFARWCRENPGHDVGVSLSLNSPGDIYRWRPLLPRDRVSSLVDADGYLWRSLLQLAVRSDVTQVRAEIRAQLERARAAGIRPSHITTDMGALLTRPDLTKAYLDLAEEYWLPAVMIELTPPVVDRLREEGFPLSDEMIQIIARYPLPKLDDIQFIADAESYEEKRAAFYELVANLPAGLTEIVAQPAHHSAALEQISPRWQNHAWAARLLADPEVQAFLKDQGVVLTDWKEIMARFEAGLEPRNSNAN